MLQPLTTDDGGRDGNPSARPAVAAIDAGSNPDSLGCDQRGFPYHRVHGAIADIGAYEFAGRAHLFADNFDGTPACPPHAVARQPERKKKGAASSGPFSFQRLAVRDQNFTLASIYQKRPGRS